MSDISKDFQAALDQNPELKSYLDTINRRRAVVMNVSSRTPEETAQIKDQMVSQLLDTGVKEPFNATALVEHNRKRIQKRIDKWYKWCMSATGNRHPYTFTVNNLFGKRVSGIVVAMNEEHARSLVIEKVDREINRFAALKGYRIDSDNVDIDIREATFEDSFIFMGEAH